MNINKNHVSEPSPFDVNYYKIQLFFSFKAVKAKKAKLIAKIANFHSYISIFPFHQRNFYKA